MCLEEGVKRVSAARLAYMGKSEIFLNKIFFPREFANSIPRPFSVRYNPYTESVEVIDDKPSVEKLVADIKYSVDILQDAMGKLK